MASIWRLRPRVLERVSLPWHGRDPKGMPLPGPLPIVHLRSSPKTHVHDRLYIQGAPNFSQSLIKSMVGLVQFIGTENRVREGTAKVWDSIWVPISSDYGWITAASPLDEACSAGCSIWRCHVHGRTSRG